VIRYNYYGSIIDDTEEIVLTEQEVLGLHELGLVIHSLSLDSHYQVNGPVVDLFNKLLSAYHQAKIKIEQQQNEIDTLKKNQEGAEQMEEYYKSLLAECKEKGGEVSRPESPYYLKMTWDDDEPCDNDTAEQRQ